MGFFFSSQKYFGLLKFIILKRSDTTKKYLFPQMLACIYAKWEQKSNIQWGKKKTTWPNTDLTFFFSLLLSFSFTQYLTMQVLDASLPVPDINEDDLERDAPPQEPQQPGAVTAPQELDGQQPEVASPLQEPPGDQAEAAGTNGK